VSILFVRFGYSVIIQDKQQNKYDVDFCCNSDHYEPASHHFTVYHGKRIVVLITAQVKSNRLLFMNDKRIHNVVVLKHGNQCPVPHHVQT